MGPLDGLRTGVLGYQDVVRFGVAFKQAAQNLEVAAAEWTR